MSNGRYDNNFYRSLNRRQHTLRSRKKRRLAIILTLVIILCAIWAVAIFWLSFLWKDGKTTIPSDTTDPVSTDPIEEETSGIVTDPVTTDPAGINYITLELAKTKLHEGDLILVNSDFPFVFPTNHEATLKPIYGNKNQNYQVSRSDHKIRADLIEILNTMFTEFADLSGKKDVHIYSAYRSLDQQKDIYDYNVEKYGVEEASLYVALPGNSEHHIGTAIDVNIYSSVDKKMYNLPDLPGYDWVTENFHRYGFILRYPEDKIGHTGIGYEPWHFRYVGVPHATIMKEKNYCLEEYTAFLRNYPFSGEHFTYEVDGTRYEIYYVPLAEDENAKTEVPIPADLEYTLSGNNIDGYIVTMTLK
ncbi:MAG: M15 family metallopeptidase [Clostridiales bacterium]|nr:M15 family metallopeptidase [Clostridiales bacterium]